MRYLGSIIPVDDYLSRSVDPLLRELLGELPAVLVVGPRAVGKTTTARRLARSIVRLDREAEAAVFRADPDAALRGLSEPVLLDEWQVVPEVLGAVKRAVDDEPHAGRFILTGSVRAELDMPMWPGTGRLVRVAMTGLSRRELTGRTEAPSFVDRVTAHAMGGWSALPGDVPDLRGYVEEAVSGAFPAPMLHMSDAGRRRWLRGYLDQLITRDVSEGVGGRDPVRLRRYFTALAANTAGVVGDKTLYDAAGLNAKTAASYDQLLDRLFIVDQVPAWASSRLKRLVRSPKRYVTDSGLAAVALGVDVAGVMRDGDLLGRLLDTFVAAQIGSDVSAGGGEQRMYHLRTEQGRQEIDLIVEMPDGRVIGLEVKAAAAPSSDSARHLHWLADRLGDRFLGGFVLHTGPRAFPLSDRVAAVPICALWA